jgi:signal transduction histidine kinase
MKNLVLENKDSQKRILIADDDPSTLKGLSLLLQKHASITGVSSGSKAIEVLQKEQFDLIVTDFQMKNGSGLDIIKFSENQRLNNPIILITSFATKDLLVDLVSCHIFGFIEKPFDSNKVVELVKSGLNKGFEDKNIKSFAKIGESASVLIHDIVNPLALIDLKAEELIMVAEQNNDGILKNNIEKVKGYSQRITNLVKYARSALNHQENTATFKRVQSNKIMKELHETCINKAINCKVSLNVDTEQSIDIFCDKNLLLRAFINLVNNAIDAVENLEENWVSVKFKVESKYIIFSVTDSGKGIAPSVRDKMFDPLYSTKGQNGCGLGLKIVQDVINKHSGTVNLNMNSANTEFVVSIPK